MTRTATARTRHTRVMSQILGPIDVETDALITFPAGLYGFPACHTFALLPTPQDGTWWLQSVEESALTFLLVDPFLVLPGHYHIDLTDVDLARLRTGNASDILVLAIVTISAEGHGACTANLQAPILFNLAERTGWQCIRVEDGFSVRESIDLRALVAQPA